MNRSFNPGILVVDDEEYIRIALERILKRLTPQVYTASGGEEALEKVEREDIHLVLLDLKMPGMDGMEVLKRLKNQHREIIIIVITGFAILETAVEAMKLGAYDFIPKPFDKDHILLVVERATENIRLKREKERLEREKRETLFDLITEKSRLKTIMDVLPNGVIVTNRRSEVVLMNQAARKHLEIPLDLSLGRKAQNYFLCHPEIMEFISSPHENHSSLTSSEFQMGKEKYLLLKKTPIITETQKFLGHVVISVDITPLKKLDQLKSEFVARVSHELRGSLSTIHEQIALVLQDMLEDPTLQKDKGILERARKRTKGLTQLIERLLDLSRIESGQVYVDIKDIGVRQFLENALEMWRDEAQLKGQKVRLLYEIDHEVEIRADPRAFKMMMDNLVGNAIKYTPEGGSIEIAVSRQGERVKIAVKDTGIGIPPGELDKIFEKFYRPKSSSASSIGGTGLGLAIVKGIVSDLKGEISVESEEGKGSTFIITLPISK